jgi:RimJ/RimL family protein N-acetyltransferase
MSGAATPPTFELGPARMRPFEPDDAAAWLTIVTDPAVTSCTSWSVTSPGEMSALVARIRRGYADGSSRRWALDIPGHGLAGSCGFKWWDARNGSAEIAYELAPRFWRRGITRRAVRAALDHGFTAMALSRVEATVMVANEPSVRLLEAAGFIREGRLRECRVCAGVRRDFFVYGLLQREAAARGS